MAESPKPSDALDKLCTFLLPPTEEWQKLRNDLSSSSDSSYALVIVRLAAEAFSQALENFAIEHILSIPIAELRAASRRSSTETEDAQSLTQLMRRQVRTRIFRFQERVTPEILAQLSGFIDHWDRFPFLEAIYQGGQLTDISMIGLEAPKPEQQYDAAIRLAASTALISFGFNF